MKNIKYNQLPPFLQTKYKNSIIFEKENIESNKKFEIDIEKIKLRRVIREKTMEEKLEEFKINPIEEKNLRKVFENLSAPHNLKFFTKKEIVQIIKKMDVRISNAEIQKMIWEFDEDLNKKISEREFINMYKKCTIDKASAQSKNLFHLTQFLMFCKPKSYKITVEDTLELLFVRCKIEVEKLNPTVDQSIVSFDEPEIMRRLDHEIKVLFQGEQKTQEGTEREISFEEYLKRINERAIKKRKREIEKAKSFMKYGSRVYECDDEDY